MKSSLALITALFVLSSSASAAFVGNSPGIQQRGMPWSIRSSKEVSIRQQQLTKTNMVQGDSFLSDALTFASSSNMWLSTIDSDIANISDNEFAPIFLGGIIVMFGGVMSALVVGYILDSRDLYANVVADSYAQGADDEAFWRGLSDEEKKKAQALIKKLNDKKGANEDAPKAIEVLDAPTVKDPVKEKELTPPKREKDIDMFSDYAEGD